MYRPAGYSDSDESDEWCYSHQHSTSEKQFDNVNVGPATKNSILLDSTNNDKEDNIVAVNDTSLSDPELLQSLEKTKKYLRSTLLSHKGGVEIFALDRDYYEFVGERIPYSELKFDSLESLLRAIPSVCTLWSSGGLVMVKGVAGEASQHIQSMVSMQKTTNKGKIRRRWKGKMAARFSYAFSDGSDCDDFDFTENQELSDVKVGCEDSTYFSSIGSTTVSSSPSSTLTSSDLMLAIESGDLVSVLSCLEVLDVNTELPVWGDEHFSPILLALARVQPGVLKALIERGGVCKGKGLLTLAGGVDQYSDKEKVVECANIVIAMKGEKVDCTQRQGMTPLMLASKGGCEVLVNWLLSKGANINKREGEGWTALMLSVDRGMGEVARLLLDKGADPMIVSRDGQRALDIAACGGSTAMQDIIESFSGEKGRSGSKRVETVKKFTEMENVLLDLDLKEYLPAFRNHTVGLHEFLLMRDDDLVKIGVDKVEAIKKLLDWQAESVKSDHRKGALMLNTTTTTAMIANISQHTRYLKANIGYVRAQLRDHGERLLCAGGDLVTPRQLLHEVDGCDFQLHMLGREVKLLRKELDENSTIKGNRSTDIDKRGKVKWWSSIIGLVGILSLSSWVIVKRFRYQQL